MEASDPSSEGPNPVIAAIEDEVGASGEGGGASVESQPSSLEPRGGEEGTTVGTGMAGNDMTRGRGHQWQLGGGCGGGWGAIAPFLLGSVYADFFSHRDKFLHR
jgi:hypothetical protein